MEQVSPFSKVEADALEASIDQAVAAADKTLFVCQGGKCGSSMKGYSLTRSCESPLRNICWPCFRILHPDPEPPKKKFWIAWLLGL